jgi:hypothetical protein
VTAAAQRDVFFLRWQFEFVAEMVDEANGSMKDQGTIFTTADQKWL